MASGSAEDADCRYLPAPFSIPNLIFDIKLTHSPIFAILIRNHSRQPVF
jgi:hypothetical protein